MALLKLRHAHRKGTSTAAWMSRSSRSSTVHPQAAQKARQRLGEQEHRDRVGPRLRAARADRRSGEDFGVSRAHHVKTKTPPHGGVLFWVTSAMGPQAGIRPFSTKRTCATKVAHHGPSLKMTSGCGPVRHAWSRTHRPRDHDQGGRRLWIRSDAPY